MSGLTSITQYAGVLLAALTAGIVLRCALPLFRRPDPPETWAALELPDGGKKSLNHWECALGRAKDSDIVLRDPSVARNHAVVQYTGGDWTVTPLSKKGEVRVGGQRVETAAPLRRGSRLRLGDVLLRFSPAPATSGSSGVRTASRDALTLLLLGAWQLVVVFQLSLSLRGTDLLLAGLSFLLLTAAEWGSYALARRQGERDHAVENAAFFLTAIGFAVTASADPGALPKECLLLLGGLALYFALGLWLRDLDRVRKFRWLMGGAAMGLLVLTLLTSQEIWGARNWLIIAGQSLQPSEFVKIAYIYAGAATLDRLYQRRKLLPFIVFSAVCVGALALMGDFGTALVFFTAFLVISFVRSGSFVTVLLALGAAALAVALVLDVRPYVAQRFASWGHVWEDPLGAGYQQVRAMSALASGGLFGRGAGNGWLRDVVAADTDLVFAMVCEELGLATGLGAALAVLLLPALTFRRAGQWRSAYYVTAACGAVTVYMAQMALNVFGSMDLLPFTGVTFPFISRGGSSLVACWGMLAFLTAGERPAVGTALKPASRSGTKTPAGGKKPASRTSARGKKSTASRTAGSGRGGKP